MKRHLDLFLVPLVVLSLSGCYTDFETLLGKKDVHSGVSTSQDNPISSISCNYLDMKLKSESGSQGIPNDLSIFVRAIQVVDSDHTLQFTFSKLYDGAFPNIYSIIFKLSNSSMSRIKPGVCTKSNGPDVDTILFSCKVMRSEGDQQYDKYDLDGIDLENEKTHSHAAYEATLPQGCNPSTADLPVYMQNELISPLVLSDPKTFLEEQI